MRGHYLLFAALGLILTGLVILLFLLSMLNFSNFDFPITGE